MFPFPLHETQRNEYRQHTAAEIMWQWSHTDISRPEVERKKERGRERWREMKELAETFTAWVAIYLALRTFRKLHIQAQLSAERPDLSR